jgi:Tol biopolymer transport system component
MKACRRHAAVMAAGCLVALGAGLGLPTSSVGASVSLPGRLAYFSETDDYSNNSTEALVTARPDGSDRLVLFTNKTDSFGFPAYSPSGRELAYFDGHGSTSASIDVIDTTSKAISSPFKLTGKSSDIGGIGWSPDGQDLVFGSNQTATGTAKKNGIWSTPAAGGSPTQLSPLDGAVVPGVAPDGDIYYVVPSASGSGPSALWQMNADGSLAHLVFRSSHALGQPSVSPNGRTVALSVSTNATTGHIISITSQGTDPTNLTPPVRGRDDADPTWSPDGSHLVFLSSRAGRYEHKRSNQLFDGYVMAANGSGVTKVIGLRGNKAGLDWITWGNGS